MRKRNNRIWCRLNDQEYQQIQKNIAVTGLTQEAYLRKLILGIQPKEAPPLEYHELIKNLIHIGQTLNQIAAKYNSIGMLDDTKYVDYYLKLVYEIYKIQKAID
jgi:predicted phage-related endonuclease